MAVSKVPFEKCDHGRNCVPEVLYLSSTERLVLVGRKSGGQPYVVKEKAGKPDSLGAIPWALEQGCVDDDLATLFMHLRALRQVIAAANEIDPKRLPGAQPEALHDQAYYLRGAYGWPEVAPPADFCPEDI